MESSVADRLGPSGGAGRSPRSPLAGVARPPSTSSTKRGLPIAVSLATGSPRLVTVMTSPAAASATTREAFCFSVLTPISVMFFKVAHAPIRHPLAEPSSSRGMRAAGSVFGVHVGRMPRGSTLVKPWALRRRTCCRLTRAASRCGRHRHHARSARRCSSWGSRAHSRVPWCGGPCWRMCGSSGNAHAR